MATNSSSLVLPVKIRCVLRSLVRWIRVAHKSICNSSLFLFGITCVHGVECVTFHFISHLVARVDHLSLFLSSKASSHSRVDVSFSVVKGRVRPYLILFLGCLRSGKSNFILCQRGRLLFLNLKITVR